MPNCKNRFYLVRRFCILLSGILCSCVHQVSQSDVINIPVRVEKTDEAFIEAAGEIDAVVIDESKCLLGSEIGFYPLGSDFLFVDKKNHRISRFSSNGLFLNEIGHRGNGPSEYSYILNVQVHNDTVIVFSLPDKILRYSAEGECIGTKNNMHLGLSSLFDKDGLMVTYYGYTGADSHRIAAYHEGKECLRCLPLKNKVMSLDLGNDLFYGYDDAYYLLDSYVPSIYRWREGALSEYLAFDLGKYAIKDVFFEFKDPFKSAEYLMSSDYSLIYRYICDSDHQLVQINIHPKEKNSFVLYGLSEDGFWRWFTLPEGADDPVSGPFRFYKDGCLYCLLGPEHANAFFTAYASKINNSEILNNIKNSDAHIVAKIRF